MKQQINPFVSRMLTKAGYILPKLQSAIDSAYNQGTKIDEEASKGAKLTSAQANEKTGEFIAREVDGKVRKGKLTDPLRFIAWNQAFSAFCAKQGDPSDELNSAIIPIRLKSWLDDTMRDAKSKRTKATAKATKPAKITLPARVNTPAVSNGTHESATTTNG